MQVHPTSIVAIAGIVATAITGRYSGPGILDAGRQRVASGSVYLLLFGFAILPADRSVLSEAGCACIAIGVLCLSLLVLSLILPKADV